MNTSKPPHVEQAFAVWLTGLPASGKSTVTVALVDRLAQHGVDAAVLESDVLRKILTPRPTYSDEERDTFYSAMVYIGRLLVDHGVPVIFDATANRRAYRDEARAQMKRFVEVYVDSPLDVCVQRDPKGIYRQGSRGGTSSHVPGLGAPYEPPLCPEVVLHGAKETPQAAAGRVVADLIARGYVPALNHPV